MNLSPQSTQSYTELNQISKHILDASFRVHSALGPGLLESAYEHCLCYELAKHGIHEAQLLTYLKLSNKQLGLLINFNVRSLKHGIKRMIHDIS